MTPIIQNSKEQFGFSTLLNQNSETEISKNKLQAILNTLRY